MVNQIKCKKLGYTLQRQYSEHSKVQEQKAEIDSRTTVNHKHSLPWATMKMF